MLAAPSRGFVFLATTKCASTSVEAAIRGDAEVIMQGVDFKHTPYRAFERFIIPLLEFKGYPRSDYEVVCLFREPIDWLASWWRYRSRPQLATSKSANRAKYAGDLSFDEFANAYMDRTNPAARIGKQAKFIQAAAGDIGPDRIYRLDDLDLFADYLTEKTGRRIDFAKLNRSPARPSELDEQTRDRLMHYFRQDYLVYRTKTYVR